MKESASLLPLLLTRRAGACSKEGATRPRQDGRVEGARGFGPSSDENNGCGDGDGCGLV
jgi:hypothetical protein